MASRLHLAGTAFGGLTGALVGLGVSKDKAIRYESQVKAGKFLVTLQGDGAQIERALSDRCGSIGCNCSQSGGRFSGWTPALADPIDRP
jgi:hypothetical protein